ncbi:MAG: hypothetical protein RDA78_01615 [Roseibium sp.]|uniref:hypothetical protein n=1 Tax=Roseibium sp. TaxID=1936156 RepID=UPI003D9C301A
MISRLVVSATSAILLAAICLISGLSPVFALSKDEAMTVLLDAVTRDEQCRAAENLLNNYPEQLTPIDREYTKLHVGSLNCEFLQNASPAPPNSQAIFIPEQSATKTTRFGPLEPALTNSKVTGLLSRSQDGTQHETTKNQDGFFVEFIRTPGEIASTLPWLSLYRSIGRPGGRTFSTTVKHLEGTGADGIGLVYNYKNQNNYYLYTLNIGGYLKFVRVYGETYPFDQAHVKKFEIIAHDRKVNQSVWAHVIVQSAKLSDYPNTLSFALPVGPDKIRPYKLSIVETNGRVELYVDNELFHIEQIDVDPNAAFGIGVLGTGSQVFLDYSEN